LGFLKCLRPGNGYRYKMSEKRRRGDSGGRCCLRQKEGTPSPRRKKRDLSQFVRRQEDVPSLASAGEHGFKKKRKRKGVKKNRTGKKKQH